MGRRTTLERYGDKGDYWYHRMRGQVTGTGSGSATRSVPCCESKFDAKSSNRFRAGDCSHKFHGGRWQSRGIKPKY